MTEALVFWALLELAGLAGAPLAGALLARLPGAGLGLGKVVGLGLVTWLAWVGGSTTLVPFGTGSALGWAVLVAVLGLVASMRGRRGRRAGGSPPDPLRARLFWGAELVFAVAFAAMALLVAFVPDVWGTEKPMDMAFLAAAKRAPTFPPADPWLAGADLNYYYLGHLAMALPVRLSGVRADEGYNLALAALFALTATTVFMLAATVWGAARGTRGAVAAGLGGVGLVCVGGSPEGARRLLASGGPAEYDWFAVSRVTPGGIDEFPWFSFLLGDLHAHVLALPFTGLALAVALQVAWAGPRIARRGRALAEGGGAALAVGWLYGVNAWSFPVAVGVLVLATLAWLRDPRSAAARPAAVRWLVAVLAAGVLLMLPFHLSFDPSARGIGLARDGRGFAGWAREQLLVFGSLALPVGLALLGRLLATRRPGRNAVWLLAAALFAGSLLAGIGWAHVGLLAGLLLAATWALLAPNTAPAQRMLWLLAAAGLACVLVPEVAYVRDAFDGTREYRLNTVFKARYHAWLLLGLAAVAALAWTGAWPGRRAGRALAAGLVVVAAIGAAVYPVAGTDARTRGFAATPRLDGLAWLRERAPGDPGAIAWLDAHAGADAVVLESTGEDYSAYGHARISTYTGLPTVLGWAGHELQWGHRIGTRARDVATLYRATTPAVATPLLRRYRVTHVVVGPLERTDHGTAGVAKWDALGERVHDAAGTTVWELR